MDKTLEIVLVAMTLIVAAVVVVSTLQGQTQEYGDFSEDRTESSDCTFGELKYERALDCSATTPDSGHAQDVEDNYGGCTWADANPDGSSYCP